MHFQRGWAEEGWPTLSMGVTIPWGKVPDSVKSPTGERELSSVIHTSLFLTGCNMTASCHWGFSKWWTVYPWAVSQNRPFLKLLLCGILSPQREKTQILHCIAFVCEELYSFCLWGGWVSPASPGQPGYQPCAVSSFEVVDMPILLCRHVDQSTSIFLVFLSSLCEWTGSKRCTFIHKYPVPNNWDCPLPSVPQKWHFFLSQFSSGYRTLVAPAVSFVQLTGYPLGSKNYYETQTNILL